ncbi:uncharacterized protein JCM10292_003586 [Rhodotorula paludigena]|uniref:uncharacterized protein n=1 Tax=Rhodotorula paludigena TaxID=86838 RepID=UPI0031734B21
MTPQWLFSVIVFAGFLGLHYNALVIDQRPLSTTDNPTAANPAGVSPGTTCASFARDLFHPGSAKRKMREAEAQLSGASEAAGPPRTLAPTSALHPQDVDIPMSRRGSTQSPAGPAERSWYTTGLGRRPKSSTGAAIMVTVEQEQVCDGETCARWYAQQEDEDNVAPDQRV